MEGYYGILDEHEAAKVDLRKDIYSNALRAFSVVDHHLTFKGVKLKCSGEYVRTKTANGPVS
jgi:hypothetical protein